MLAGAWLGGQRGVLLLQSSGVGNCINMLSLPAICQHAAADARDDARRLGRVQPVADPDGAGHAGGAGSDRRHRHRARTNLHLVAPTVLGAANLAFNTWRPAAVLIGQRVLGAKNFKELAPQMNNPNALLAPPRRRRRTAARLAAISWSSPASARRTGMSRPPATIPTIFRCGARWAPPSMIGLGLALAQPKRRVLVITGDGEMLMSIGSLATIAVAAPGESDRRGARQRALRRDRHAEDPHRRRRRSRRHGGRRRAFAPRASSGPGRGHRDPRPRPCRAAGRCSRRSRSIPKRSAS